MPTLTAETKWRIGITRSRLRSTAFCNARWRATNPPVVDAGLDRYWPELIHPPAVRSRLGQLGLSSQSADHEDAELEKNDEWSGQQQGREGVDPRSHHVGPDEDADPELQPVASEELRADNPGETEHRH